MPRTGLTVYNILLSYAREVKELGGFAAVTDERLRELTEEAISRYVHEELHNIGFAYVTLDLMGYRTGSMNETLTNEEKQAVTGKEG